MPVRPNAGFGVEETPKPCNIVLVTGVGAAAGSRAAAAALACAGSDADRAGLLIDLDEGRAARPSLLATAAARRLEERLAAHLADVGVASRGATCHLKLPGDAAGIERIPAALPLARDSAAVVHLPPPLLQAALAEPRIGATAALLRADLGEDRSLTALAVRDLLAGGLRVAVLKRPLDWLTARRALLGALPVGGRVFPLRDRLLHSADKNVPHCYDEGDEPQSDRQEASQGGQGPSDSRRREEPARASREAGP
jgi:hypothetical protein